MTYEHKETYSIAVAKLNNAFAVATGDMTEATKDFIFAHGLKQLINDAHSGKKDLAEIERLVTAKINCLEANETTSRGSVNDTVGGDFKRIALTWIANKTGSTKKAIEATRTHNNLSTPELLEMICDKAELSYTEVKAEIDAAVEASKVKTDKIADKIDLSTLLG